MKQFVTRAEGGVPDQEWMNRIKEHRKGNRLLFHIYSGISDQDMLIKLMDTIHEAFPDCHIVGTESGGEIKEGALMEQGILVSCMLFECTEIRVLVYENLAGNERKIGKELRTQIDRLVPEYLKAAETLLPGALLNTLEMYEELETCDPSVCIFGGYAGNDPAKLNSAFVMADGKIYPDACVVTLYLGKEFHINAAKSAGWEKLGMPFKITGAKGNLLREINGIPAADVYRRYLNIAADEDFVDNTSEFPLAAYVGDEELLRHTNTLNPDGSLLLAGSVVEGWDVYLTFGNPSGIIEEVNRRLEKVFAFNPQAILLYSCYVRKLFWERFVNVELDPFEKIAPTAGFNTFGEVLRNMKSGQIMEYNITLLSIAMREGDGEQREGVCPRADDASLSGQSSLINRLAKLVRSSTMEIQNAYKHLEKVNHQLRYTSEHNSLTGLYNRRKIERLVDDMMEQSKKTGQPSTVIMFDIDHFKRINDTFGHRRGDLVLQRIARITQSMLDEEKGQAAGRWGGEEFFVLLPGFGHEEGAEFAEALRKAVETHEFGGSVRVTISLGYMTVTGNEPVNHVYMQVDNALYEAKEGGRNRVCCAD